MELTTKPIELDKLMTILGVTAADVIDAARIRAGKQDRNAAPIVALSVDQRTGAIRWGCGRCRGKVGIKDLFCRSCGARMEETT